MRYYLAGGALRDILLGLAPREFDIVFDGSPEDLAREHAVIAVGGKTPVYLVKGRDHMPLDGTIAEDLQKRDITINALLMGEDGILHALPETYADLRDGHIRHVSPTAFFDDPVRVLRAARFAATLSGFSIVPETVGHMREAAAMPRFRTISAERVGRECMKAMAGHAPGTFPRALAAAGCLGPWLSPLDAAAAIPAGPELYHGSNSVLDHTAAVMDAVAAMPFTRALKPEQRVLAVWMALCHDLGKTATDPALLPHHIGHEQKGAAIAVNLAARLRLPKTWNKAGRLAAAWHMRAGNYRDLRPGTRVDLLSGLAASGMMDSFCALVMADTGDMALAETMRADLGVILSVSLKKKWRGLGAASGVKLRELRAQALAESRTR